MNLYTTLKLIKEHQPCTEGYRKLRRALGKGWGADRKIPLVRILETNGMDDAIWALRAVDHRQRAKRDRLCRLFALDCAEHVLFMLERVCPGDDRLRKMLQAAREFVRGEATGWDGKSAFAVIAAYWGAAHAVNDVVAASVVLAATRAVDIIAVAPGRADAEDIVVGVVAVASRYAANAVGYNASKNGAENTGVAARVAERGWQKKVFRKYLESA